MLPNSFTIFYNSGKMNEIGARAFFEIGKEDRHMTTEIERYLAVLPNERQLRIQQMGFYAFFHFGMNTMTDKEWGDGKDAPSLFNPAQLDTDQWCRCVKEAGMKGVILTAKHHDGFCLWPSKYTDYSIKNSPYKDGKGDIVKELSESCQKYGLKFGIYLSPWDRHSEYYGTEKYDDYYIDQLTELLTNYGEIFCIWMDGACGSHLDGKPMQVYDFPRYFAKINELQPNCALSNCGPDVRWVGNEAGYARSSEWSVVPAATNDVADIAAKSQTEDTEEFREQGVGCTDEDLGSRAVLSQHKNLIWYPAEVDVSIRPGWFYHKKEDKKVRSTENLLNIYYNSVGGNCLLLLNIPPDDTGRISAADEARLKELGSRLKSAFEKPVAANVKEAPPAAEGHGAEQLLMDTADAYMPAAEQETYTLAFDFGKKALIDKVELREDTRMSQRVEAFEIYARNDGQKTKVFTGTVVGMRKVALFKTAVEADGFELVIRQCRSVPCLSFVKAYITDGKLPKPEAFLGLKKWWRKVNYKLYVFSEEVKKKIAVKK